MLILACGSRSWTDAAVIERRLRELPMGAALVHGGARGADQLVARAARRLGIPERAYPADWRAYGKRAGVLRNLDMLALAPDLVLAFWDGRSTGTAHVLGEAARRSIPVEVVTQGRFRASAGRISA